MSLTKISRNLITTFLLNPNINPNAIAPRSLLPKVLNYSTLSKYNCLKIHSNNNQQQQHYRNIISTCARQLFTKGKYQELKQKISELDNKGLNSIINLAANEEYNELKNNENWNRLIMEFVEEKEIKIALELFDKMKSLSLIPNQEAFTAILRGLSEEFVFQEAAEHTRTMVELMDANSPEFKLETEHINYLLKTCQKLGNLNTACDSYDKYIKSGNVKPDKSTYLYLLITSFKSARSDPALAHKLANDIWDSLDKRIDVQGEENNDLVPIDNDLIRYILATYKSTSHVKDALNIAECIYGIGKPQSTPSLNLPIESGPLNTILDMCINGKQFLLGLKYYDQAIKKYPDMEHDINLYNSLMTLYNSTFQFDKTVEVFNDKIKDTGLKPNKLTFEAMMLACHNLRDLDSLKYFFDNYLERGIDLGELDLMGLIKLSLKRARIDGGPNDAVWLLDKLDEMDPAKEENKKLPQIKNIDHLSYLSTISMAYEIALEVEDLPEDKKARWQKDREFFEEKFAKNSDEIEKLTQEQINHSKSPKRPRKRTKKINQPQPNMGYNKQSDYIPSNMNYDPRAHNTGRYRPFASNSFQPPPQRYYRQSYNNYYYPPSYNDREYNRSFASPSPPITPYYQPQQQYYDRNGRYYGQSDINYNLSAYSGGRYRPSYQPRYNNNKRPGSY
ncbi:8893_t:CDS:2 [Entrophospora sp. SA101]|nr:8893_t:CDS:2 [Entrophospora sp. SA101]